MSSDKVPQWAMDAAEELSILILKATGMKIEDKSAKGYPHYVEFMKRFNGDLAAIIAQHAPKDNVWTMDLQEMERQLGKAKEVLRDLLSAAVGYYNHPEWDLEGAFLAAIHKARATLKELEPPNEQ